LPEYPVPDNQQPTSPTGVHRPIQALAPRHPACFFLVKNKCSGFESNLLDTTPRIGLLGKMKLRKCAPIAGPPRIGFFVRVCALSRASPDPPQAELGTVPAAEVGSAMSGDQVGQARLGMPGQGWAWRSRLLSMGRGRDF